MRLKLNNRSETEIELREVRLKLNNRSETEIEIWEVRPKWTNSGNTMLGKLIKTFCQ